MLVELSGVFALNKTSKLIEQGPPSTNPELSRDSMALAQQKLDSGNLETSVQLQPEQSYTPPTSSSVIAGLQVQLDTPGMEEVDYESLPTGRLSVHLCAGAAAGVMEHCAMYPVDCVKVRVSS